MADIDIQELVWDTVNEAHIWDRHQLTRPQVEEMCYGTADNLHVVGTYGSRYLVVGPKRGGKLLAAVLAPKGAGRFYPVTARPASQRERRAYRDWKAGKQP